VAAHESSDGLRPRRAGSPEHAASQAGAIVADQVRAALEAAERAATDMRRRALDHASADREAVHGTAGLVTARIDLIEAEIGQLLQELRDEVARIVEEADRAAASPAVDPPATASTSPAVESGPEVVTEPEPTGPQAVEEPADAGAAAPPVDEAPPAPEPAIDAADDAPSWLAAPRRRRGLFRHRRAAPSCGVCGRTAQGDDEVLERWQRAAGTSLCPACQASGWQIPDGGTVPYRPVRQHHPS
jgi:hypothetical protein